MGHCYMLQRGWTFKTLFSLKEARDNGCYMQAMNHVTQHQKIMIYRMGTNNFFKFIFTISSSLLHSHFVIYVFMYQIENSHEILG